MTLFLGMRPISQNKFGTKINQQNKFGTKINGKITGMKIGRMLL